MKILFPRIGTKENVANTWMDVTIEQLDDKSRFYDYQLMIHEMIRYCTRIRFYVELISKKKGIFLSGVPKMRPS